MQVIAELTEVQRYINVSMRWCEQYPSRERREFWIAADNGNEEADRAQPRDSGAARAQGNGLTLCDLVVGLANLTTRRQVNFVLADPPLLVRGAMVRLRSASSALASQPRWPGMQGACWSPCRRHVVPATARAWAIPDARGRLRRQVDSWLATVGVPAVGRTMLRRAK